VTLRLARLTGAPLIATMSRPAACCAAFALIMLGACHGDAAGPSYPAIATTDVAAVDQAIAQVNTVISDPALTSTRTVSLPFNLVGAAGAGAGPAPAGGTEAPVFALAMRRATRIAQALTRVQARRDANLGDFDIPPGFYGGTFVRLGSYFRRDTTIRGAPANGVRIMLYERDAGGFSTNTRSGLMEVIDKNRRGPELITTARVVAADSATVAAVSANRHYEPSTGLYNVFDVLSGTMGRGATPPIFVIDSLIDYYGLTSTTEWEAVTTTVAPAGVMIRAVFPADSQSADASFRFAILVGGKAVRIDGIPIAGSPSYDLTVFVSGQFVGHVTSANVHTLGDSTHTADGTRLPQPLRDYVNSVGRLIEVVPVAAQIGSSAALLLQILDGTPLP
jgi:hypothetical protein